MKFQVLNKPDLFYVAHEIDLGKRKVWGFSFLGRDGNFYQTLVADSKEDAINKAQTSAKNHDAWPRGQKAFTIWNLGAR